MKTSRILPNRSERLFLTDGGLDTTLIFINGLELPFFASFDLLKDENGYAALKNYYSDYLKIARDSNAGFILESPTWRANRDWMEPTGYPISAVADINRKAVEMMTDLREGSADNDAILI